MECKHCGASFEGDICPYCRCKAEKPEPQIKEIYYYETDRNYRRMKANPPEEKDVVGLVVSIIVLIISGFIIGAAVLRGFLM